MPNPALTARFMDAYRLKKNLDALATEANAAYENVGQLMRDALAEEGLDNLKITGGPTITPTLKYWGSAPDINEDEKDTARYYKAMRSDPTTAALVSATINANTLSSFLNELPKDEAGMPILPRHLQGNVKVTAKPSFSVRGFKDF
jgi:hypothetical protein